MPGRYHSIDNLPATVPVFPLSGVLVLPRGQLPLNVFEPRYLTMVDDVLAGHRLIGMIQPTEHEDKALKPALSAVGCVGRLSAYRETDDGRYLITLSGICRFRVAEELVVETPYRQVRADFAPFAFDLGASHESDFPRERLFDALKAFLAKRDLKADWQSVMNAPGETLVNALSMLCPFEPAEKQALLEAHDWEERVAILTALLEMASAGPTGPASVN
jgi:Lon protease-like protein